MNTIKLKGKKVKYGFGLSVLTRFAAHKEEESVNASLEYITGANYDNLSPEDIINIATLIHFAFQKHNEESPFTVDEIIDTIFTDAEALEQLMTDFLKSVGLTEGNAKAPEKGAEVTA